MLLILHCPSIKVRVKAIEIVRDNVDPLTSHWGLLVYVNQVLEVMATFVVVPKINFSDKI